MASVRSVSSQTVTELRDGWSVWLTKPDSVTTPDELSALGIEPIPATVPGTVVSALRAAKSKALEGQSPDDWDVWYRCQFEAEFVRSNEPVFLDFGGLATLAEVWLNGSPLLTSANTPTIMFLPYQKEIGKKLQSINDLCIRFRSLNKALEARRPRPRWRTHLVDHQQLRWFRTTLLGRMPGWHHRPWEIRAVGPWRSIALLPDRALWLEDPDVRAEHDGRDGILGVAVTDMTHLGHGTGRFTDLFVRSGESVARLQRTSGGRWEGTLRIPEAQLWWPHTHGEQPLYPVEIVAHVEGEAEAITFDLGRTGFRTVTLDQSGGDFAFSINGERVFLRGACWTTADAARLIAEPEACYRTLTLLRDAGMNLLRIPGTGFPESDWFYDSCAELGITIWQDFPFALMDYPSDDSGFRQTIVEETVWLLDRLQTNPALILLCGNSECEATAALHGLTAEQGTNRLFTEILPEECADICPDVPYIPSSQWGGDLPFHVNTGVAYDYGVGAYLRPLEDARRSGVRFASECLGFANIPEDDAIDAFLAPGETPGNHPSWKAGVPRNCSLGWDFDDVRDHYVRELFGEDTKPLLYSDTERYLALGRAVVPEIMAAVMGEWRRPGSSCNGAIVLMSQDLWPGAGWGILDNEGRPKSAYYGLKRIQQPLLVTFSDEGLSGLRVHVVNERPEALDANLRITLYRHGQTKVHDVTTPVRVEARGNLTLSVDGLIGHFLDTAYAFRFGPPAQDVTVAVLQSAETGETLTRAFHFPAGRRFPRLTDLSLTATARPVAGESGEYALTVRSERFAQCVNITARGYRPDDNYFHLEPGIDYQIRLRPVGTVRRAFSGQVTALNSHFRTQIGIGTDVSPANMAV